MFCRQYVVTPLIAAILVCVGLPLTLAAFGQLALLGIGGSLASASSGLPAIVSATTYYVCAKGAGGTCVYNGDGGTTASPSDSNDCLTKGTPCATIQGVATKLSGLSIGAIVTVQLADTAGTGTDCYRPNNTIFNGHSINAETDTALQLGNGETGAYPSAYLYLNGNDTTPSNVILTGATTCAGTTANDSDGVRFSNYSSVRIRGMKGQYIKSSPNGPGNGMFEFYAIKSAYAEDLYYTGDTTTTGYLLNTWRSSLRMGSSLQWSITSGHVINCANESHCSFITPLGRANIAVTTGAWTANGGTFMSNEGSHMGVDGLSLTVTGNATGNVNVWYAIAHSMIMWNDASTFTAPAMTHSYQGGNLVVTYATIGSFINDLCRTTGQLTCNIGNTTAVGYRAKADTGSFVYIVANATSSNNASAPLTGSHIITPSRDLEAFSTNMTFANLGTPGNANYTFCTDCTSPSNPATGSGTGAFCVRQNSTWKCF